MNPELIYLLKINIALMIFYLFYWLFLRKDTFYTWNRYYLIVIIPLACLLPSINFFNLFSAEQMQTIQYIAPHFPVKVSGRNEGLTPSNIFLLISVAGTGILLIRLLIQITSLYRIQKHSVSGVEYPGLRLRYTYVTNYPFSFMQTIYINPDIHNKEDLQIILRHETIHVKQKHSLDILLYELACCCLWYNPFIWLLRQTVRQNIEYYTDKQVLKTGCDRRHYQQKLLMVSQIPSFLGIANNFNFNHLKKRIMMMNKKQSGPMRLFKFALIIPVFTGMTLLSNAQEIPTSNGPETGPVPSVMVHSGSGIALDKEVHDFGTIKESDGKVSAVFSITNTSDRPLVIEDVKASCGCTTPEWTKEPIAPGKQGHVKATYDPTNRISAFDRTVTVKTNGDPSTLTFHIKGTVVK